MTSYIRLFNVQRCVVYRNAYLNMLRLMRMPRVSGGHICEAISVGIKMGIYSGHDYAIGAHE